MQANPLKQPRGNHPGLPFMYIGKAGEGRRFMCPLYKCDEQGPEVAACVMDEELRIPADQSSNLKGAERQRADEMLVFQSFASVSGLPIDEGSAENSNPDHPDILCTISGQKYWFELGRIINEEVAEKLNPSRRKRDGGFSYDQGKPFVDLINSKASKKYVTEGAPADLVLHFDLRLGTAAAIERLVEKHATLLDSVPSRGPFERVWVFDEYTKTVLWPKV
jgi:hypothetical protein